MVGDLSSTNGGKASSKDERQEEVILANGVGNLEFLIEKARLALLILSSALLLRTHAMRQRPCCVCGAAAVEELCFALAICMP